MGKPKSSEAVTVEDFSGAPPVQRELLEKVLSKQTPDSLRAARSWVSGDQEKLEAMESSLAKIVENTRDVTPEMLKFLGELEQERTPAFVEKSLAWALETEVVSFSDDLVKYIKDQVESLDPEANLEFHKVLDFVHQHAVTVQDPVFSEKFDNEFPYKGVTFFLGFCMLAEKGIDKCRNYLVKKHLQDILETWQQASSKKPGALHGVAGGTSDQTIYTFSHVRESYKNRLRLGINEGYPIANPVLPIAPNYYGYYRNGNLENIFQDKRGSLETDGLSTKASEAIEQKYISGNDPRDEYIYDDINRFDIKALGPGRQHLSNGLTLLQTIWDFEVELKGAGRTFYFDMSRITNESLHPLIVGDLLTKNQEYRRTLGETKNTSQPIPQVEFMRQLYPSGVLSEERLYHYKNLSRLHMRKKIEDDFGLDLSRHDLWTQRAFLEFLETRSIENVEALQGFVKTFGEAGLKTFLSLEYGRELGDGIIAMGEKLPQDEAEKIFAKYGELVSAATDAEASLRNNFPDTTFPPELVSEVRENLLRKGRDMLASFSAEVKVTENVGYELTVSRIEQELALLRGDAALFAAGFKELSGRGEKLNLAEIKDITFEQGVSPDSFSSGDRERMKELYKINYAGYPEFQKMLLDGFDVALADSHNQFYVLRYKGVIEGFYRLGITAQDTVYFGAFNMNPKYAGSGLGEALMQQSLDVRAKDSVIKASCTATLPIASNYIERGFVGTQAEQVKEIYSMSIVRQDSKKAMFHSKELSGEEIISTCENSTAFMCKKVPLSSLAPEHFALLSEQPTGDSRFVLTRYIRDKNTRSAYLVFEKTDEQTIENFSTPEQPILLEAQG